MLELFLDKYLHPPCWSRGTYIFRLFSDGNLEVFFGKEYTGELFSKIIRFPDGSFSIYENFDDFINQDYLVIIESGSTIISSEQLIQFKEKIKQIKEKGYETNGGIARGNGIWKVILRIKTDKHVFIYGLARDEIFDEIVDMLIEVSPIEIIATSFFTGLNN